MCAVPLQDVAFLTGLLKEDSVSSAAIKRVAGDAVTGQLTDGALHPTSGKARVLLTLYATKAD